MGPMPTWTPSNPSNTIRHSGSSWSPATRATCNLPRHARSNWSHTTRFAICTNGAPVACILSETAKAKRIGRSSSYRSKFRIRWGNAVGESRWYPGNLWLIHQNGQRINNCRGGSFLRTGIFQIGDAARWPGKRKFHRSRSCKHTSRKGVLVIFTILAVHIHLFQFSFKDCRRRFLSFSFSMLAGPCSGQSNKCRYVSTNF